MASHAETVPEYCATLVKSQLLPEAEVAALRRRWREETGASDADVDGFRKYLVARKSLTGYQATLVQRGHSEGFRVGGYTILDRVGKGQTAGVYRARHASGQVVALKVLPASKARDPDTLGRFQREGRLLTQLDHPNVVRAFQLGRDGSVAFIVMEYLDGETLDELLARRKRLPAAEAVRLVSQALAGLQHLHGRHMVHRDLKPANLMLTPPGGATTLAATLKILDIGIGRGLFDDTAEGADAGLTAEGAILGTPDYLAPEQARDARTADIRADIYSLGCVLFHLIAGRPPFAESGVMAQMVKHATERPAPLASVGLAVPPGLQEAFDRLTAKRPGDRYATPEAAAEALRPFSPSEGADAEGSDMLPAYKAWLETESSLEMPAEIKKLVGTATEPILPAEREAAARDPRPGRPNSAPVPTSPARVLPVALPPDIEVNVELVPPEAARPLTELNRRDLVMLGLGGVGVGLAVSVGVGLARLLRQQPPESP